MKNKNLNNTKDFNHKDGLILGAFIENDEYKFLRAKPLPTLVIAPVATGKTSFIISNLLTIPNSSIVLDFKGNIFTKTANYRAEKFNNEIIVLTLNELSKIDEYDFEIPSK